MSISNKKEKIIKEIEEAVKIKPYSQGRNSMGASESYYNPDYMVGKCFSITELKRMSEEELLNLLRLANFASDVFY